MLTSIQKYCRRGLLWCRIIQKGNLKLKRHQQRNVQSSSSLTGVLNVSDEVQTALNDGLPVVALESTIITHGMPYPHNVETALSVETIIREQGSVPATVGIIKGKIHIGLSSDELVELGGSNKQNIIKTSRRDLPYVLSQGCSGGTTVSGTMIAAHMAGIDVFVTGGIGGVHREGQHSMDISADLTELSRTPITVVSAGVKSILDIGRTLEYLETQGVCVATFGKTNSFPAFFTPDSGFTSPYNVETAQEAAAMIYSSKNMDLGSGILIAVPIPEDQAASGKLIEDAIQTAIQEASSKSIHGKKVTPYILQRVHELTEGKSLQSNIALIENNARVGSRIAVELCRMKNNPDVNKYQSGFSFKQNDSSCDTEKKRKNRPRVVVIGGTNVDFTVTAKTGEFRTNGATHPGSIRQTFGGVGRNIADCLTRLDCDPIFLSALGTDQHANLLSHHCSHMDLSHVTKIPDHSSATYCAILNNKGQLLYGVGDFNAHTHISPPYVSQYIEQIQRSPLVLMDGNIPAETMQYICDACQEAQVPVWFEPADIHHVRKLFQSDAWRKLYYSSPNLNELRTIVAYSNNQEPVLTDLRALPCEDVIEECIALVRQIIEYIPNLLVTIGRHGLLLCRKTETHSMLRQRGQQQTVEFFEEGFNITHFTAKAPQSSIPDIVSVSGAGDCLAGTMIAGIISGKPQVSCLRAATLAAHQSLQSTSAVPDSLSTEVFQQAEEAQYTDWQPQGVY